MSGGVYRFGKFEIPYPVPGVPVFRCQGCGLVFKGFMPRPSDLLSLLLRTAEKVWRSYRRHYSSLRSLILRHLRQGPPFDLLDVGSSDGALVALLSDMAGRRSGLDVVRNPRCESVVHGEYILGFLDKSLQWSQQPYDVVTAFDVLEHLYDPSVALDNLARFVKVGGILVIQTGDAGYPARSEVSWDTWWYANLFEHNVFWRREALRTAFEERGFEEAYCASDQQKDRAATPMLKKLGIAALRFAGRDPVAAKLLFPVVGRDPRLLADPFARDHLTMVLQKAS